MRRPISCWPKRSSLLETSRAPEPLLLLRWSANRNELSTDSSRKRSNNVPGNNKFVVPAFLSARWPFLTLIAIAAVWLYRTPYSASNLEVPPDAVEYALAPLQLLETGRYEIIL